MSDLLSGLLATHVVLLADGATGTNLFEMGLKSGDAPELWNAEHPDRIAAHYRSFVDAGSDIVLTNSFGANRYRLALHQAEHRVAELNEAAVSIARDVLADVRRSVVVAGSMGPTGEVLAPVGSLDIEDAQSAFAEQAQALARAGADALWIETLSSREEVFAALAGATTADLPVVCTLSFDTNGRTMMGLTPGDAIALAADLQTAPLAIGANCGVGASEMLATVLGLTANQKSAHSPVVVAKANCGIPEFVDGAIRYNGTPELMAAYACLARDAGARIIGGCCGTTPRHVRAMREALDRTTKGVRPDVATVVEHLGPISNGAGGLVSGAAAPASPPKAGRGGRRSRSRSSSGEA